MAGNFKYTNLPDLDLAPDVYETPDLAHDVSTHDTSATTRSNSPVSAYKDLDDGEEGTGISRRRLDPDEARTHFLPQDAETRKIYRVDGRRDVYQPRSGRRKKKINGGEVLGDLSDEEGSEESVTRKLARLRRETEELKNELDRNQAERSEKEKQPLENQVDQKDLDSLSKTLDSMSSSPNGQESAATRLVKRLQQPSKELPRSTANGQSEIPNQQLDKSTVTIKYLPTFQQTHSLAKVADFDARLTSLESALGIDTIPLPTEEQSNTKPILPTLDVLSRQLSTLTSSGSTIDTLSRRVKQLTHDAEKLSEARKAATQSLEDLHATQADLPPQPSSSTANKPNAKDAAPQPSSLIPTDPETESRISALYGTLPTIESLAPILPSVLDRLRSLRLIHADAANASQLLKDVERRQTEMGDEILMWREGLEKVEKVVGEGEGRIKGNMEVVEGWVRELEGRMDKLG